MAQLGNLFYNQFGPWKPFPHPIDYPLANPTDEPYLALKFNVTWRPYIVGALSALARPETYAEYGTGFIKEDIDWGGQLPWLIEPYTPAVCPNWTWVIPDNLPPIAGESLFKEFAIDGCGLHGRSFFAWATTDPINEYCELNFRGDDLNGVIAGGNIRDLWIHQASGNNAAVIHIFYTECAGFSGTVDTLNGFEDFDLDWQQFSIKSTDNFMAWWTIDYTYNCSGA